MQDLLMRQQSSMAAFVAANVNDEIRNRVSALELLSKKITPELMQNHEKLHAFLQDRQADYALFNNGIAVAGVDGTVIAEYPLLPGRLGANFSERDYIKGPLKDGVVTIGRPVMSKLMHAPAFVIGAPIRDSGGKAIGVLGGVIDLRLPNFLDNITGGRYGNTGTLLIVSKQHRLIITSSDKARVMEQLPAPGVNAAIDAHLAGQDTTEILVNPQGTKVLSATKTVPAVDWYVAVSLPTEEAFAPIRVVERKLLLITIAVTLAAGLLAWWMLKRQLSPILSTVKTLAVLSESDQPPKPLPVPYTDEVGDLIAGFNRLLNSLALREDRLQESETRFREIFNAVNDAIFIHDAATGAIVDVNRGMCEMYGYSREQAIACGPAELSGDAPPYSPVEAIEKIRLAKTVGPQSFDWLARRRDGSMFWTAVSLRFARIGDQERIVAVVRDVTDRKRVEDALQASLGEKEALLKEVHHRVKNNLQVITSLLRLERGRTEDVAAKSVLTAMQDRIRSLALLHESIYRAGTFAAIDLGSYLNQIATECCTALRVSTQTLRLRCELGTVQVGLDQAMPCGLLVSELISNALKHGFPDGRSGEVFLELRPLNESNRWQLRVSDTGVGLSEDFEAKRQHSLGLQLVAGLASQIGGRLDIGPGATFTVEFTAVSPNPLELNT